MAISLILVRQIKILRKFIERASPVGPGQRECPKLLHWTIADTQDGNDEIKFLYCDGILATSIEEQGSEDYCDWKQ